MKNLNLHRFISVLLCIMLAFGITGCGNKNQQPSEVNNKKTIEKKNEETEKDSSSIKEKEESKSASQSIESEEGKASLAILQSDMTYSDQLAGAVAYLGYKDKEDNTPLAKWIQITCSDLTNEMPFILEIPKERILGPGYGDLYCIVPRDEDTGIAVDHVKWKTLGHGSWPVSYELLYLEEKAKPLLVFVNFEEYREQPDIEIKFVSSNGTEVNWCPLIDEYENLILPTGDYYEPLLMDFWIYGIFTGLDYPEDYWEPGIDKDDGWVTPTEAEISSCTWQNNYWTIFFNYGDSDPDYAGTVELYYFSEDRMDVDLAYIGIWRMEDDCLRLEITDSAGNYINGSFPVLIDPEKRYLHVEQERGNERGEYLKPPFFDDDMSSIELWQSYG